MGACGSTHKGCVKVGGVMKHHRKPRRSVKSQSFSQNISKVEPCITMDRSYSNPTFQPNIESWFDTDNLTDSDCDDEFYSVQDEISQIGSGSISTVVTPRFSDHVNCNASIFMKLSENLQMQSDNRQSDYPVFLSNAFAQCIEESFRSEESETFNNCGLIQNTFLPCLVCTSSSDEKNKHLSPRSPSTKKRTSLKISIKWGEGQVSPRAIMQRPIAGSQIPCCPLEKKMSDSWSRIDPNTFKVRGQNYFRDKKKEFAPNHAAFYPFGVDVFLSSRKIDHIARFIELPAVESTGDFPPILVVNVQIPLYPATIFQNEYDGESMNLVLYFKLSENYSKELPVPFQDSIRKLINDEVEKTRGFPVDTYAHFRERLKILGRVANVEDLSLSAAERKLINAYNEKPVLSRPQHEFYLGQNYLEIDLDMHRFSYIARKGLETFQDKLQHCVLDFGLTIQGNKGEDLPENMLCCVRLKEIDYTHYDHMGF